MKFSKLLALALLTTNAALASTQVIESPELRLEITTNPYSYKLIEKSTGETLVSQSQTHFKANANEGVATRITQFARTSDIMIATLELAVPTTAPTQTPNLAPTPVLTVIPDTIQITFTFTTPKTLQIQLAQSTAKPDDAQEHANVYLEEHFNDQNEHYYGLWEYPYRKTFLTPQQNPIGTLDNRGVEADLLGGHFGTRGADWVSARAPFYVTSKKYGVYVDSLWKGHYKIANQGDTSFTFDDSQLTYYIIYGPSYAEILNAHNTIAGPAFMPPLWAFGTIWWRDDLHEDMRGPQGQPPLTDSQQVMLNDAMELARLKIPAAAMWFDRPFLGPLKDPSNIPGWGNFVNGKFQFDETFPDPASLTRTMTDRGYHLMTFIANRTTGEMQTEGKTKDYLFHDGFGAIDVRNPQACQWFGDHLDEIADLNIQGFKIDRGDEHNLLTLTGKTKEVPLWMTNYNAVMFAKLASDVLEKRYGKDKFIFSRMAYDRARQYTALWNGDTSGWTGLQESLKHGLRAGTINYPMWGTDTGGYKKTEQQLYARWTQFTSYVPMMELLIGPNRTPWYDFDARSLKVIQNSTLRHHDMIPYARSLLYKATQTGMPPLRQMIFAYPDQEAFADTWDQYMYGSELLVAPIMVQDAVTRTVALPPGQWIDYNGKKTVYQGSTTQMINAPLEQIPVFARAGAIVPHGDIARFSNQWTPDWKPELQIDYFPVAAQTSSFDYYDGEQVQTITASADSKTYEVRIPDLRMAGKLQIYCRDISNVYRNNVKLSADQDFVFDADRQLLTVPFQGETTVKFSGNPLFK